MSGASVVVAEHAPLLASLSRHERLAIAVSGGVDSLTLAHFAWRHLPDRVSMYHATGPAVPEAAGTRVRKYAGRHGWPLMLIDAGEQADERYRANPLDRCYYCKSNLYARIRELTSDPIASGTNRDDLDDFRPGLKAAEESAVVHPYVEAGMGKESIYRLAASLGLADLERLPAQPCLASRVETGIAISPADLSFIDAVEAGLAARLGEQAVLRCRVTRSGVVVELAEHDETVASIASEIGSELCAGSGRRFLGVRRYLRGAAFLRPVSADE